MDEDKELLDIVDEKDNVIGQDTKENKFRKELISRNVAIFILDNNKKLLIVKRSPYKKSFPNRYDLAACGNVKSGESYQEAAIREVKEELSINCNLKFFGKIFNEFKEKDIIIRYFTGIFLGYFSEEVKLNDELVELKRLSVKEVEDLINKDKELFTPGFIKDFLSAREKLT
jgi:isopentenyldiphosphate isomerase